MIIGIDPGASSAIATLANDGSDADVFDIPNRKVKKGKRFRTVIDIPELSALASKLLSHWSDIVVCESVHAMPAQGVTSSFGFGQSFGILQGVFTCLNENKFIILVTPQKWKKHFGLIGKDKEAARLLALKLYPHLGDKLRLKKNHDRAEALLIARWYLETTRKDA